MDQPTSGRCPPARPALADDVRLLPSRVVAMRERDEDELVDALAELLVAWLELRPERLPVAVGPSGASALVSGFSREEEG